MENYENAVKIALFLPSGLLSYLRCNGDIHKRNNISLSQYVKNRRRNNKGFPLYFSNDENKFMPIKDRFIIIPYLEESNDYARISSDLKSETEANEYTEEIVIKSPFENFENNLYIEGKIKEGIKGRYQNVIKNGELPLLVVYDIKKIEIPTVDGKLNRHIYSEDNESQNKPKVAIVDPLNLLVEFYSS